MNQPLPAQMSATSDLRFVRREISVDNEKKVINILQQRFIVGVESVWKDVPIVD